MVVGLVDIYRVPSAEVNKGIIVLVCTSTQLNKDTEDEIRKAKKCMKQKIARYFGLQNKPSSGATKVE